MKIYNPDGGRKAVYSAHNELTGKKINGSIEEISRETNLSKGYIYRQIKNKRSSKLGWRVTRVPVVFKVVDANQSFIASSVDEIAYKTNYSCEWVRKIIQGGIKTQTGLRITTQYGGGYE